MVICLKKVNELWNFYYSHINNIQTFQVSRMWFRLLMFNPGTISQFVMCKILYWWLVEFIGLRTVFGWIFWDIFLHKVKILFNVRLVPKVTFAQGDNESTTVISDWTEYEKTWKKSKSPVWLEGPLVVYINLSLSGSGCSLGGNIIGWEAPM